MTRTSPEVSSNFAHNISAPSGPPASFDNHLLRHPVSYESTVSLVKPLSSSFSVLAYHRGPKMRQSGTAHFQK